MLCVFHIFQHLINIGRNLAGGPVDPFRQGADFIQRCIFPGGMLPSPTALREQAARAGLVLQTELLFGDSYAATLVEWRRRFLAAWPAIAALGVATTAEFLGDKVPAIVHVDGTARPQIV